MAEKWPDPSPLAIVDTETDRRSRYGRRIWEMAALRVVPATGASEWLWLIVKDFDPYALGVEPEALEMNRFFERHPEHGGDPTIGLPAGFTIRPTLLLEAEVGPLVRDFTHLTHLVGANPRFDEETLDRQFLGPYGIEPTYHYHLENVSDLARGWLAREATLARVKLHAEVLQKVVTAPYRSGEVAEALGVERFDAEAHTGPGDVFWAALQHSRIFPWLYPFDGIAT